MNENELLLFAAAKQGNLETVKKLILDNLAKLECKNEEGHTALSVAATTNQGEIVSWLLQHGACIHKLCYNLDKPEQTVPVIKAYLELFAIVDNEPDKLILELLKIINNAVNAKRESDGNTLLHLAVSTGNVALVQILLEKDANLELQNNASETVWDLMNDRQEYHLKDWSKVAKVVKLVEKIEDIQTQKKEEQQVGTIVQAKTPTITEIEETKENKENSEKVKLEKLQGMLDDALQDAAKALLDIDLHIKNNNAYLKLGEILSNTNSLAFRPEVAYLFLSWVRKDAPQYAMANLIMHDIIEGQHIVLESQGIGEQAKIIISKTKKTETPLEKAIQLKRLIRHRFYSGLQEEPIFFTKIGVSADLYFSIEHYLVKKYKANINKRLIESVKNESLDAVRVVIEVQCANVNYIDHEDARYPKMTPLLWAAYQGNNDIIRYLIEKGAVKDKHALFWAIRNNHISTVDFLVQEQGYEINCTFGVDLKRPIDIAIKHGYDELVSHLINKYRVKLYELLPTLNKNETPRIEIDTRIMTAAFSGLDNPDVMLRLLEEGIFLDYLYQLRNEDYSIRESYYAWFTDNKMGDPKVAPIIPSRHIETFEVLREATQLFNLVIKFIVIEKEAESKKADETKKLGTERQLVPKKNKIKKRHTDFYDDYDVDSDEDIISDEELYDASDEDVQEKSLIKVMQVNDIDTLYKLLASLRLSINGQSYKYNGNTLLHLALLNKNKTIVDKLLANGARVDIPNVSGETVLELALKSNDTFSSLRAMAEVITLYVKMYPDEDKFKEIKESKDLHESTKILRDRFNKACAVINDFAGEGKHYFLFKLGQIALRFGSSDCNQRAYDLFEKILPSSIYSERANQYQYELLSNKKATITKVFTSGLHILIGHFAKGKLKDGSKLREPIIEHLMGRTLHLHLLHSFSGIDVASFMLLLNTLKDIHTSIQQLKVNITDIEKKRKLDISKSSPVAVTSGTVEIKKQKDLPEKSKSAPTELVVKDPTNLWRLEGAEYQMLMSLAAGQKKTTALVGFAKDKECFDLGMLFFKTHPIAAYFYFTKVSPTSPKFKEANAKIFYLLDHRHVVLIKALNDLPAIPTSGETSFFGKNQQEIEEFRLYSLIKHMLYAGEFLQYNGEKLVIDYVFSNTDDKIRTEALHSLNKFSISEKSLVVLLKLLKEACAELKTLEQNFELVRKHNLHGSVGMLNQFSTFVFRMSSEPAVTSHKDLAKTLSLG